MAPPRPALAQSESKARFFERLGLDERSEAHKRLYAMMKEEAVEGRRRVTMSPDSLAPAFRNDTSVEPPYSSSQISETAFHREILQIYQISRPETRWIYDLGRDTERVEEENWVIRWMLWHVFRYRDNRNRNRRTLSPGEDKGPEDSGDESGVGCFGARLSGQPHSVPPTTTASSSGGTRYWDPVRDS